MPHLRWLALWGALQGDGGAPGAVVRHALAAVEGDSVTRVRDRWARAVARDPGDRAAALGLATLARLSYQDSLAERGYLMLVGPRDGVAAHASLALGLMWRIRGQFGRAESTFAATAGLARSTGDSALAAEALIWLGSVRGRVRNAAAALATLDSAALLAPAHDLRLRALEQCSRAETLTLSGQPGARAAAETGALLAREGTAGRVRAACLHIVAALQARQGAVDSALATYRDVIAERRLTRDRAGLATALQWRASMYRGVGWLGHARGDLDEAAAVAEGTNPSAVPWIEVNRAVIGIVAGDLETARVSAARATPLFAAQRDVFGTLLALGLEGGLARLGGDLDAAERVFAEAHGRAMTAGFADAQVDFAVQLAQVALRRSQPSVAARWLSQAEAAARRQGMAGWLKTLAYHRGVVALRRGDLSTAERLLRAHLAATLPAQPNWRYQSGARLAEVLAGQGRIAAAEEVLTAANAALDAWRGSLDDRQLRLLVQQTREDDADGDLGVATVLAAIAAAGGDHVARAFALAERGRARTLADGINRAAAFDTAAGDTAARARPAATVGEIAAGLPDDSTALLEYVTGTGGEPTTLILVTRGGARAWRLTPEDSLAPLIARFGVLAEAGTAPTELARTLGAALLDSAAAALPSSVHRLVVVPDGVLHRMPFDALTLADGRYVLERFAVTLAPSATVAFRMWQRPRSETPGRMLVMADPTFGGAASGASDDVAAFRAAAAGRGSLPRLRGTSREARLVVRYAPHATLRRRGAATEAWLKHAALEAYQVVHFASHAVVDEGSLSNTALALAPGGGEDGFVNSGELARLALAADLVVLSACRTAGGQFVRGEGVQGLATPLLAAGARAVAATWWPIGDTATVRLVGEFYDALAAGLPAGDALRTAKLAALKRGAPAREWAAFTLIGDPFARPPLRTPPRGLPPALLAAAAAAALLLGYGVWILTRRAADRA